MKNHFAKKFTNEYIKLACNVKLDKFLHKLAKNIKFNKSKKTMEILHDQSKLREMILHVKDVIILDPNTMKSKDTASLSTPCPRSMEEIIPKITYNGH